MSKKKQIDSVMAVAHQWLAMAVILLPMLVLFFKPTPEEALGFYFVDFVCYLLILSQDTRLYHWLYPKVSGFFPQLRPEIFAKMPLETRQEIYREMLKFPRRRSVYLLIMSILKVIPAFLYVFLVWGEETHPMITLFKGIAICAFFFSYQIGLCFLEYHNMVSGTLKKIHEESNWSDVFRNQSSNIEESVFHKLEVLCAISVWIFWVAMLILILLDPDTPRWVAILQVIYISAAGFFFISRLLITSRRQIMDGIQTLVDYHQSPQEKINPSGVALSTYPVIARYQRTLNQMVERHLASEREIHRWIVHRAEKNRYLDLGRITGLLVHDLITPLTVMQHCLSTIEDKTPQPASQPAYLERLRFCVNQITDLVLNVRSSIRDKTHSLKQSSPEQAHRSVLKLVSYFYENENFRSLTIDYKIPAGIIVMMPQPELNQVFLNLYSNAIRNLLSNKIPSPYLGVAVHQDLAEEITLSFTDNGTGLSASTFNFLTENAEPVSGSEGIGLKLTRRLVEVYGGNLFLREGHQDQAGTQFLLSLKKPKSLGSSPAGESEGLASSSRLSVNSG